MKNLYVFPFFVVISATAAIAAYNPPPQKISRSLSEVQIDKEITRVSGDVNIAVPAWYAKQAQAYRHIGTNNLAQRVIPALDVVIADSRRNIPELEGFSDMEVAQLYMAQMFKSSDELRALAPTNSLEYLIGAGIRADVKKMKGGK